MRVLRGNDILINWSVFYDAGGVKTNVDFSNSTLSVFILDSYGKRAVEHTVSGNVISIHYGGEIQRLGTIAIDAYWQNNNTLVWSRAKKNEVVELVDNPESVTLDGSLADISITTINTSSDTFFGGTYNANFSNYYTKNEIDNKIITDYNFLSNKPLIYDKTTGKYTAVDTPINFVNNINIGNFVASKSGINFTPDGRGEIGTLIVRDRLILNGVEITGSGTGGLDVVNMWNVLGSTDDSDKQINVVHLTDALSGYLQTSIFDDLFEKVNIGTLETPKYAIKAKYDFYSIGEVSAFGAGSSSGSSGGGLIQTVYGINGLSATYSDANLAETFNAATIKKIYDDVVNLQNTPLTYSFSDITGLPTTLSGYGITDGATTTEFNALVTDFNTYVNSNAQLTDTQKNILSHLQVVNGKLQVDIDFYSTGEVSAFGAGSSGSSSAGGLIQTVYGYSSLGGTFNNDTLTDTFNAYTINQLHARLSQVEAGAIGNGDVSSTERTNWNIAYTNSHTHANKSLLDAFSQSDNDVLNHLSIVGGKLKVDIDLYSLGEVSAFGAGSGSSGSGLIQTVYGLSGLGGNYSDATLTDTFNAYTINSLHDRINSLEAGSALNFSTTGSGNVVTSIAKSGNIVTVTKGLTFSVDGHTHSYLALSGGTLSGNLTAPTFTGSLIGNANSATKVNHTLTFTGYSTGTFDGSAVLSIAIPNNTNQLVNGAGYLKDNQTITVSGDATGSGTTSITLTLANSGVDAGTYNTSAAQIRSFTIDSKGRVTSVGAAVTIQPDWDDITRKPTTISGYGITDALLSSSYTAADVLNKIKTVDGEGSGLDADYLRGCTVNRGNSPFGRIPFIRYDGVMDIGRHINMHYDDAGAFDYSIRLICQGNYENSVNLPTVSGTLALLSDNVASATKLSSSRFIWGQTDADGTGNISGTISGVTSITMSGAISGGTTSSFSSYSTAARFYSGYDSGATNAISCSGWFRSNGTTGWINDTYGGGINMTDSTYVRVYNNKAFWVDNSIISMNGYSIFSTTSTFYDPEEYGDYAAKFSGGIAVNDRGNSWAIWANGSIVSTGEITAFGASDARLKSNIKQIDSALDFLSKVKTYEFDWNEKAIALNPLKAKRGAGVIAQEMSLLDNNFVHSIYGDYLGVDYERFIPYLIGGVNEVADEVTILKKRVAELELEIKQLKK